MTPTNTIMITGATGLVGTCLCSGLSQVYSVLTPTKTECDITDNDSVNRYSHKHAPSVIIHAAAFTDVADAERERGDKNGVCWRVNVDGTKHIVDAAKSLGAFVVYISTGSVFAGDTPPRTIYRIGCSRRI